MFVTKCHFLWKALWFSDRGRSDLLRIHRCLGHGAHPRGRRLVQCPLWVESGPKPLKRTYSDGQFADQPSSSSRDASALPENEEASAFTKIVCRYFFVAVGRDGRKRPTCRLKQLSRFQPL